MPLYDEKYVKTKVKEFNGVTKRNFLSNEIPKENVHYAYIGYITIDSVMKMEKNKCPQVYLEECKYKIRKTKMSKFINIESVSDSESESEPELEFENELK